MDPRFASPSRSKTTIEKSVVGHELTLTRFTEYHAWLMAIAFFTAAFTIYSYFNITLITVLQTSKIFAFLGATGFLAAYLIRKPLRLSIADGLFYNLFGTAPIGLALMLAINAQCNQNYTETYRVVGNEPGGNGYTCILENNALEPYWHIRNLDRSETNSRGTVLEFSFCDGRLGFQVMQSRELK